MSVPKPNYTQTPNRFIDEYMSKVSPHASMVYFVICRKTIGWHKDTEEISLSQIVSLTGISRNTVLKAIAELEAHGLINVTRKGSGRKSTNVYELNFEPVNESQKPMDNSAHDEPKAENNGSCDEQIDSTQKVNSSRREPINDLIGSGDEPISAKNGSCREHTKEIVLNKDLKESTALAEKVASEFSGQVVPQQKTAAPAKAGTPFNAIDAIFKAGSEKHTGQPYYKDAKESRQIKLLEARYTHDPERFLMLTRRFYWMITKLQDEFWNTQPFTPSAFNSLYNRIASYQPSADIQKREERGSQTDDEWFLEKYGNCTKQQLDYFYRAKMINKADYEMLVKRLLVEAAS